MSGAVAPLFIRHVSTDPRFVNHPGFALYGIESYIAVPLLRRDGSYFGTLCALDQRLTELSEDHLAIFQLLASLISFELEADEQHRRVDHELLLEKESAMARERLLGILGHDLRTPLTAVTMGADDLIRNGELKPEAEQTAIGILASARRAARMVRDLLDFTRARLAGGIPIRRDPIDLRRVVARVLTEIRVNAPGRLITFQSEGDCLGLWDADRAAQVVSNLVGNALQHGLDGTAIEVTLRGGDDAVGLEVINAGEPLAQEDLAVLFSPFRRTGGGSGPASDGLGLGLFIVEEIMKAHGGSVASVSSGGRISFRTVWPR